MENGGSSNNGSGDADMTQESLQLLLDHLVENESIHTDILPPSIFMVPSVLRDLSPSSFNPMMVSIGPLHKEDVNLQAFEVRKSSYLLNLTRRINYPKEEILKSCLEKAYTSMNRIKACYVWTKTYSDAEIAKMMVMDACFILEFMTEFHISTSRKTHKGKLLEFRTIRRDLALLENQVPLFFLDEIFRCIIPKFAPNISLIEFIYPVLSIHNLFKADLKIDNVTITTTHHILSLLHQCYTPPDSIKESFMSSKIHTATDLNMAGVNFKPSKDPTWVMAMEVKPYRFSYLFSSWSKPTLTMPVLKVHDFTEYTLRNLIAYEQFFPTESYVTSYAVAIDMLVNTQEDVATFVESKVLDNCMGTDKEAANMINNVCKNVPINDSFYEEEWKKLNRYYDGYWPKHIAKMRSTYFSSPWSIIALFVGIIIFVLQVIQTMFTVKSSGCNK